MTAGASGRGAIGASLAAAGGVGGGIIGGWRDNAQTILQIFDEGAASNATFAGAGYAVTHPGGVPIVVHVSTFVDFDWRPVGAFIERPAVSALLYIDGVAIGVQVGTQAPFVTSFYTFEVTAAGAGINMSHDIMFAFTTIVTDPALIAAGVHTYRLDYFWSSQYLAKMDNTVYFARSTETVVVTADVNSALVITS